MTCYHDSKASKGYLMINAQQEKILISMIPSGTTGEDLRAAYSVITGVKDEKNLSQIIVYYSVSNELASKWYSFFSFNNLDSGSKNRRGRKGKDLTGYVKSNVGKVVTPKTVVEELGISLPTFYNFYNANRGFFRKVKRGEFQIVDPSAERSAAK
jgi:predicted DNA-binding transcriptional regulator AlpA